MSQQKLNNIISDLAKVSNIGIFCGAGISYNSGLPLAQELTKELLVQLGLTEKQVHLVLNSSLPLEALIQEIKDEVDISEILKIFQLGNPSQIHKFIAYLSKEGRAKVVLTTNFDMLLENAFIEIGLLVNKDFFVYSSQKDFLGIDWKSPQIKIIKIHGCILNQ